jgi:hypothetical protein
MPCNVDVAKLRKATFKVLRPKKIVDHLKIGQKSKEEDQQSMYWQGGGDSM